MESVVLDLRQAARQVLDPLMTRFRRAALVDFPNHPNVGDSAIWLGERTYLHGIGVDVRYGADAIGYSADTLRQRLGTDSVVLIHGGGNFGDLYPHHHAPRERLLRELPELPIIQLPQTIHFETREALDATKRAIGQHRDFTLLCRDRNTLEFARREFQCRSELCTDSAFFITGIDDDSSPDVDFLCLLRQDRERRQPSLDPGTSLGKIATVDWITEGRLASSARCYIPSLLRRLGGVAAVNDLALRLADAAAWQRVNYGARLLRRGKIVITDRLHGHILCLLLNIPHVVVDSGYGKLTTFIQAFGTVGTRVRLADRASAMATASELAATIHASSGSD